MPAAPNEVFSTLADPTRRAIFERLMRDGELTVHALTDRASQPQSPSVPVLKARASRARPARWPRDPLPRPSAGSCASDQLDNPLWRLLLGLVGAA